MGRVERERERVRFEKEWDESEWVERKKGQERKERGECELTKRRMKECDERKRERGKERGMKE